MRKGQVSTELLIIVGLVLLVFIPLLVLVYFKATEAGEELAAYQAELLVFRLAYLSNSVGSLGTDTSISTDLYIPRNIVYLKTRKINKGGEVMLKLVTADGESEIVEVVKYPFAEDETELATGPAYGWARFKVESTYDDEGKCTIEITRES